MRTNPRRLGFWEAFFCFVALLSAVVIAGALGGAIAPTRPHDHPVASAAAQSDETTIAQEDLIAQQEMADWALGAMVVGLLTMFGSFFALYFVRETLRATQQTLQETQDRNAIEMRAYVVVIPKGIEQSIGEATFRGQVEVHNIGRTPAHDVSCRVWMKEGRYKEDKFATSKFKVLAKRTLLPDGRMRQGTKQTGLVSDFLDQSGHIFVYGRVDYTDYLNERRSTMFCHRYNKSAFVGELDVVDLPDKARTLIHADMARHHIHGNKAD